MNSILTGKNLGQSSKALCVVYAAIAAFALVATWSHMWPYTHSVADFYVTFWHDAKASPAARAITADILTFGLTAAVLMVVEGRRHGVRFVWAYIAVAYVVAVSVAFPLFLIARELKMGTTDDGPRLRAADTILLGMLAVALAALTVWIDVS